MEAKTRPVICFLRNSILFGKKNNGSAPAEPMSPLVLVGLVVVGLLVVCKGNLVGKLFKEGFDEDDEDDDDDEYEDMAGEADESEDSDSDSESDSEE